MRTITDKKPLRTSLAAIVLQGQKLRADETVTSTTVNLSFAAKWAQATTKGGHR